MRTTRLPSVCVLVATTRCQYQWGKVGGVGPQVTKFQQVSSDDHQMSVVGGGYTGPVLGGGGTLPCNLSNDAFDVT